MKTMRTSSRPVQWYMAFGFLATPLFFWPTYFSPYEPPKVWFLALWVVGALGLTLLNHYGRDNSNRLLAWLIFGLFAELTITSLVSGRFFTSVWGNPYRMDGLIALAALVVLAFIVALIWNGKLGEKIIMAIAIATGVLSLWAVGATFYSALVPASAWWQGRVALSFGNPTALSGYLGVSLPFSYYAYKHFFEKRRTLRGALLIQIAAIILTRTIGGLLCLALFGIYLFRHRLSRAILIIIFGIAIAAALGFYEYFSVRVRNPGYIVAEDRARILMKGVIAIADRPVWGWGWAQFSRAFSTIDWPTHYNVDAMVDRPHSSLLDMGVSGGIPALVIYMTILAISLVTLVKRQNFLCTTLAMVLIMYVVQSQTNITSVAEDMLAWFVIGVALSYKFSLG